MKKNMKNVLVSVLALTAIVTAGAAMRGTETAADGEFGVPTFTMQFGAQVRKTGDDATKNGIRFTAEMDETAYLTAEADASYDVKYGIAIIPKDYAATEGFSITAENLFGSEAVYSSTLSASEAIKENKRAMLIGESDELSLVKGKYVLQVSMVDIIESNVLREFIGTPYVAYGEKRADGAKTEYTYVLGSYYNNDVANNTRSMTYVAQRAIEKGEDTAAQTLYNTYVKPVESKTTTYMVKRYFANGYGEYTYDPHYSDDDTVNDGGNAISGVLTGAINSPISTEYTGAHYMGAYELNVEKSTKDPVVYANGKQVVELYYDIKSNLEGCYIHGFGSAAGTNGIYADNGPENLIDGSTDTVFWSCSYPTTSSFIVVDLGQVQAVSTIIVTYGHTGSDLYPNATVSYSQDGKTYTVLGNLSGTYEDTVLNFEQVSARYIRLACSANGEQWVKIAEIATSAVPVSVEIDENSKATFAKGDTEVDVSGLTYNLVYSDGSKTAADSGKITMSALEATHDEQEVTITYIDGDLTVEKTQTVRAWYVIADSEDWQLMNTYLDGWFTLKSNVKLDGGNKDVIGAIPFTYDRMIDWTGVGAVPSETQGVNVVKEGIAFTGKFDGQGYIVSNFKAIAGEVKWSALNYGLVPFALIGQGGYVGNFTLNEATVDCGNRASFIAGLNLGTIENVAIGANCTIYAYHNDAGAAAVYNNGTIRNVVCHVTTSGSNWGDSELRIAYETNTESVIENCFVDDEDHSDVLPLYTAKNKLGWFYAQDCGMYFGNESYQCVVKLSSSELDLNGTIQFYTAQTNNPGTYKIWAYVWGPNKENVFTTLEENNGIYTLQLKDTLKESFTIGETYTFGFKMSESGDYLLLTKITITDASAVGEPTVSITTSGLADIHQGSLADILDGNEDTYVWFGGTAAAGAYVQLDLAQETEVNNLQFLMANSSAPTDRFQEVKIEYSLDGATWTDVEEADKTYTDSDIKVTLATPVTARYIRVTETKDGGTTWIIVREFAVNVEEAE